MPNHVLTNQQIFMDDYELTGDSNAVALEYGAEIKDCTVFGNDTRNNKGALKTVQVQIAGFMDAATQDAELFSNIGISNKPISICSEGGAVGDIAYFFNAVAGEYSTGESVGELNKFELGAGAQGSLIRGVVGHNAATTPETATGNGTALQIGAVSAEQRLVAVLHVLESSGTGDQTLDIIVESDDNAGFTSGITRLTFTQATTAGTSEILELDGALLDDYYRGSFTITGTGSPSFKFIILFGVV
ncbi:MAG: hypothetical protein KUG81_05775 [Gammaproteobacteria bacterium]|nr:hypothetical protein [Gammaproteobacteria bacterium]